MNVSNSFNFSKVSGSNLRPYLKCLASTPELKIDRARCPNAIEAMRFNLLEKLILLKYVFNGSDLTDNKKIIKEI